MHRLAIFCLAAVGLAATLQADVWNKKTELTVNQTIQVPGATLPPGNYVVKLVDSQSNRHIVQFTNEREDKVISTVLAIPNERMEPTGESEFSFYEGTRPGEAPALRAWFYPGDMIGQQFAYPKEEAFELATATGEQVPVAPETMTPAQTTAPAVREPEAPGNGEEPSSAAALPEPAAPRNDTPVERDEPRLMAQAQPAPAPPQQPTEAPSTPDTDPAVSDLPQTASSAPLLGLIGLASLGAALGIQRLSKRRVR
jgi:hypothetical protein